MLKHFKLLSTHFKSFFKHIAPQWSIQSQQKHQTRCLGRFLALKMQGKC